MIALAGEDGKAVQKAQAPAANVAEAGTRKPPPIDGAWADSEGPNGQDITVVQDGEKITITCVYTLPKVGQIRWKLTGTISTEGQINGRLEHTKAPKGYGGQSRTAQVSADGNTITGRANFDQGGGHEFTWKRVKPQVAEAVKPPETAKPQAATSVKPAGAESDSITFSRLGLPAPVTFMATTEDGLFLICSHQNANQVSIWDLAANKLVKTLQSPSPRTLLCRGDSVFVAHAAEGTIRSFSRAQDWSLADEFDVKRGNIRHMSAPQGKYFNNEIVVACHGAGIPGSYQGVEFFHLDIKADNTKVIPAKPLVAIANVSYDGKVVLGQQSFNLSPAGTWGTFAAGDYLSGKNPKPVSSGGELQTPYVYQVQPGLFWFGAGMVFGGTLTQRIALPDVNLVIPDTAQQTVYSLTSDRLRAHRLDQRLTEIGSRPVIWTEKATESFDGVFQTRERHRSYQLDVPFAKSQDGKLRLLVINHSKGTVWSAQTQSFKIPPISEVAAASPSNEKPADSVTNPLGLPARIPAGSAFTLKLTGPAGSEYELLKGPEGLKLTKSGELTWTPTNTAAGSHDLKIRIKSGSDTSIARHSFEVANQPVASSGDASKEARSDQPITFAPLDLPAPVNYMEPTEDGKFMICAHLAAGQISVWDIAAGKLTKTIKSPAPRSLLCRGDLLFAAHETEGKIRCFSRKKDWTLINEFDVGKAPIRHLSAPHGEFFKGEVLVTCHGPKSGIVRLDTFRQGRLASTRIPTLLAEIPNRSAQVANSRRRTSARPGWECTGSAVGWSSEVFPFKGSRFPRRISSSPIPFSRSVML